VTSWIHLHLRLRCFGGQDDSRSADYVGTLFRSTAAGGSARATHSYVISQARHSRIHADERCSAGNCLSAAMSCARGRLGARMAVQDDLFKIRRGGGGMRIQHSEWGWHGDYLACDPVRSSDVPHCVQLGENRDKWQLKSLFLSTRIQRATPLLSFVTPIQACQLPGTRKSNVMTGNGSSTK